MLFTCRKVASYPAEYHGSFHGSKTTRYFLLNLGHPDVILALIVTERHPFVIHKKQGFRFKGDQTLQEISRPGTFRSSPFAIFLAFVGWRALLLTLLKQFSLFLSVIDRICLGELPSSVLDRLVDFQ